MSDPRPGVDPAKQAADEHSRLSYELERDYPDHGVNPLVKNPATSTADMRETAERFKVAAALADALAEVARLRADLATAQFVVDGVNFLVTTASGKGLYYVHVDDLRAVLSAGGTDRTEGDEQ